MRFSASSTQCSGGDSQPPSGPKRRRVHRPARRRRSGRDRASRTPVVRARLTRMVKSQVLTTTGPRTRRAAQHREPGVLDDLLGHRAAGDERQREAQHGSVVPLHQVDERPLVPGPQPPQQFRRSESIAGSVSPSGRGGRRSPTTVSPQPPQSTPAPRSDRAQAAAMPSPPAAPATVTDPTRSARRRRRPRTRRRCRTCRSARRGTARARPWSSTVPASVVVFPSAVRPPDGLDGVAADRPAACVGGVEVPAVADDPAGRRLPGVRPRELRQDAARPERERRDRVRPGLGDDRVPAGRTRRRTARRRPGCSRSARPTGCRHGGRRTRRRRCRCRLRGHEQRPPVGAEGHLPRACR